MHSLGLERQNLAAACQMLGLFRYSCYSGEGISDLTRPPRINVLRGRYHNNRKSSFTELLLSTHLFISSLPWHQEGYRSYSCCSGRRQEGRRAINAKVCLSKISQIRILTDFEDSDSVTYQISRGQSVGGRQGDPV